MAQQFDFETILERRGTNSFKWDLAPALFDGQDTLPMWVADMDFPAPEAVTQAIADRIKHPVYGYRASSASAKQALAEHFARLHDWRIDPASILGAPAVVPGMAFSIAALTQPGDRVIVQPPVYPPFFSMVLKQGRTLVENPLREENGRYVMDFDELERQAQDASMLLLSNPHNPGGRVWRQDELARVVEICRRNETIIVSDEIHCDIVYAPARHTPLLRLPGAEDCVVAALSPGKTFNIAGLKVGFLVAPNPRIRARLAHVLGAWDLEMGNEFGLIAAEAAYARGGPWLEALLLRLADNLERVCSFFEREAPHIPCMRPEGAFLAWLDFRALGSADEIRRRLIHEARVGLNDGRSFGAPGEGFFRLNFGCPPAALEEGLTRIGQTFRRP
jgi:cystathionine beta-lyase